MSDKLFAKPDIYMDIQLSASCIASWVNMTDNVHPYTIHMDKKATNTAYPDQMKKSNKHQDDVEKTVHQFSWQLLQFFVPEAVVLPLLLSSTNATSDFSSEAEGMRHWQQMGCHNQHILEQPSARQIHCSHSQLIFYHADWSHFTTKSICWLHISMILLLS